MAAIVWKGQLSFGLVSFPVKLFAAARHERVSFHMLHEKDLARIREVWYCSEEDKPVGREEIIKGYEYAKGKYVIVTDEELKAIAPATASVMEILEFVRAEEVDPLYFESSYYVQPDEAGAKPYHLLAAALAQTEYYGIAKVAMHNREHTVVLRPSEHGLVLHTMFYPDELHAANAGSKAPKQASAKEIDLAKKLIEALAGPFKPAQFHDQYRENVQHMIEQKRKGHKVTAVKQPARKAPVVDILQALKKSLEAKPAKTSKSASARKKKRTAA